MNEQPCSSHAYTVGRMHIFADSRLPIDGGCSNNAAIAAHARAASRAAARPLGATHVAFAKSCALIPVALQPLAVAATKRAVSYPAGSLASLRARAPLAGRPRHHGRESSSSSRQRGEAGHAGPRYQRPPKTEDDTIAVCGHARGRIGRRSGCSGCGSGSGPAPNRQHGRPDS